MRKLCFITATSLAIVLIAGCSSRQPGTKTTDKMADFAQRYANAWSSKDPDAPAKFFSEAGSLQVNENRPAVGRKQIAEVARRFMSAFPDMVVTMDKVVTKGEITEFHWTLDGTNSGPRGTGKRVRIGGYEEWRIGAEGLIVESKGHFDEAEYDRQIEHGFEGR